MNERETLFFGLMLEELKNRFNEVSRLQAESEDKLRTIQELIKKYLDISKDVELSGEEAIEKFKKIICDLHKKEAKK